MMDHWCIELSSVEAEPGTSADKPSMAAVPDAFDPDDVVVADVFEVVQEDAVVRVRVVPDHNLRSGDGVEVRWERVAAVVDWDMDDVNRSCLLPQNHDGAFSAASQLPLRLLLLVTAKMHQSWVHQVNPWLVPGILAFVARLCMDEEYFVVVEEEWKVLDKSKYARYIAAVFVHRDTDAAMRALTVGQS